MCIEQPSIVCTKAFIVYFLLFEYVISLKSNDEFSVAKKLKLLGWKLVRLTIHDCYHVARRRAIWSENGNQCCNRLSPDWLFVGGNTLVQNSACLTLTSVCALELKLENYRKSSETNLFASSCAQSRVCRGPQWCRHLFACTGTVDCNSYRSRLRPSVWTF